MTVVAYGRAGSIDSRGVVFIHSCPKAIAPHVEWALAKVFGTDTPITWGDQPIEPGSLRAEIIWTGAQGLGAQLASSLLAFKQVRYEVTEDASAGHEGERFAATPTLGLFRATIGQHGDVLVHEDRLRNLITQSDATGESMESEIKRLLGQPWDHELEAFRIAHEGATVRVLHQVS